MANPKTTFEFDGDVSKVIAKLNELDAKISKTGKGGAGAGDDIARGFSGAVSGLTAAAAAMGALYAAFSGVQKAVGTAAEFEQLSVRLENMYGSVERGREAFQKFQEVAASTPYSLQGVVEAGASLKAFGVDAENMIKPVSDLAAFMGIDVVEAAQAFGRAMAGGAGAADILRERGILQLVKSFKGIDDLSKLTLPQFRQALIDTIQDPTAGIVGATDKLSKTFTGAYSNMMDAVDQLANVMGKKLLPSLTSVMQEVSGFVGSLLPKQSEQLRTNQIEFTALASILTDVNNLQDTRNRAIKELQGKYGSYLGNIDLEKASYEDLKKAIDSANLAFEQKIKLAASEEILGAQMERQVGAQKRLFELQLEYNKRLAENDLTKLVNVGPGKNIVVDMKAELERGIAAARAEVEKFQNEYNTMRGQLLGNSLQINVDVNADRINANAAAAGKSAGEKFVQEYKAVLQDMNISPPREMDEWAEETQKLIEKQQTLNGQFKLIGEQTVPDVDRAMEKMAESTKKNLEALEGHLNNIVGQMVQAGLAGENMGEVLKKILMDLVAKAMTLAIVFGIMQLIPGGAALTGGFGSYMAKGFGFGNKSMQTTGGTTSMPTGTSDPASLQNRQPVVVQLNSVIDGQRFVTNTVRSNERRLGGRVW